MIKHTRMDGRVGGQMNGRVNGLADVMLPIEFHNQLSIQRFPFTIIISTKTTVSRPIHFLTHHIIQHHHHHHHRMNEKDWTEHKLNRTVSGRGALRNNGTLRKKHRNDRLPTIRSFPFVLVGGGGVNNDGSLHDARTFKCV